MRGDALASGAPRENFKTANTDLTDKEYKDRVGKDHVRETKTVYAQCAAKGCEDFFAYSLAEYMEHFHRLHA